MSNQITPNPSVPTQVVAGVKFPKFVTNLGIIPTSYKDSMSYYECLAWLCKFLEETVIPTVNENGEAVEELQNLYIELNSYVTHYFDTLDVQEEINNKLDDMVEQGTLQEIIADYLNSKAVFGFDTVADMKASTNLINGSYAETLGFYAKNDGGSALYKIRTITNDDVVDEMFIIEMNDEENQLVAELINYDNIHQIGCYCDGTHDDTVVFQKFLTYIYENRYKRQVKLLKNDTLLLSEPIYINHSLEIICEYKESTATIKNITTNIFNLSDLYATDNRIWNLVLKNISLIGSGNNNCFSSSNIQLWDWNFENVKFSNFNNVFQSNNLYLAIFNNIHASNIKSFGTLKGSDNTFNNLIVSSQDITTDRADYLFTLESLYLSRFNNCFLTGGIDNKGAKSIFNIYLCKDLTFDKCWIDYASNYGFYINLSNFINVSNCTIRGCALDSTNINDIRFSTHVTFNKNSFINNHIGTQNMSARPFYLLNSNSKTLHDIIISENNYEIPFSYGISSSNYNDTNIKVYEPQHGIDYNSTFNYISKYNINDTTSNGITYWQDNDNFINAKGTATANVSIYLIGSYGSSTVVKTLPAGKYKVIIPDNTNLLMFNNTTILQTLSNNAELTLENDLSITAIAIRYNNGQTYVSRCKPVIYPIP